MNDYEIAVIVDIVLLIIGLVLLYKSMGRVHETDKQLGESNMEAKTCFGKFDKDNCDCIICNVIMECCEYKEDE